MHGAVQRRAALSAKVRPIAEPFAAVNRSPSILQRATLSADVEVIRTTLGFYALAKTSQRRCSGSLPDIDAAASRSVGIGLATCGWLDGRSPRPFVGDTRLGVEQAMAGSKERQRHWSTLANDSRDQAGSRLSSLKEINKAVPAGLGGSRLNSRSGAHFSPLMQRPT